MKETEGKSRETWREEAKRSKTRSTAMLLLLLLPSLTCGIKVKIVKENRNTADGNGRIYFILNNRHHHKREHVPRDSTDASIEVANLNSNNQNANSNQIFCIWLRRVRTYLPGFHSFTAIFFFFFFSFFAFIVECRGTIANECEEK